jgi:hypothetical protein
MTARMTRQQLKSYYLRAMAADDPLTADFFFQAMKKYDETLALYGKKAARATLPRQRARRKSGRLDLNAKYLDALKAGDVEGAAKIKNKIVSRDKSGMQDSASAPQERVLKEFKSTLAALR